MLDEGSQSGVIEKSEHQMVRNVFRLDDRRIGSFMVPSSDLVWLDVTRSWEENLALIAESGHSRYPVCRGGLHDILGVLGTKQLVGQALRKPGPAVNLGENLQPAVFVPNWLSCMELLHKFRAHHCRMVFVVDEYGEVQGLVALNDVLESVTGDFQPDTSEESWAFQREDGSWLLDGLIPLQDLKDCLGIKGVPGEDKARYHTLSGMIMWLLGRVPHTGDIAEWECWRLEVVDLDGKRVDKVLASRIKGGDCESPQIPFEAMGDGPP
jgi:putative hemolysin